MLSELSALLEKKYDNFSEGFEHVDSFCGVASVWRIAVEHAKERQCFPGRPRT